jgi:hypothetical protein
MADDRGPEIEGAVVVKRMAVLRPHLIDFREGRSCEQRLLSAVADPKLRDDSPLTTAEFKR